MFLLTWYRSLLPYVVNVHTRVIEGFQLGVHGVNLGRPGPKHPVAVAAATAQHVGVEAGPRVDACAAFVHEWAGDALNEIWKKNQECCF